MASTPLWATSQVVEFRTPGKSLPYLALRPRCAYIFESVAAALTFFQWTDGSPWELRVAGLGWTVPSWLPLGLLADCVAAASLFTATETRGSATTLVLEVHPLSSSTTPDAPPAVLPLYDARELFFQSIKQSLFLRTGSAAGAVCMPLPEQAALWSAVAEGHDVSVRDSLFKLSMYAGVAAPDAAALGSADFLHVSLAASVLRPDGLRAAAAAAEVASLRSVPVRLVMIGDGGAGGGPATGAAASAPFYRIVQRRIGPTATLGKALRTLLSSELWPAALAADADDALPVAAAVEPSAASGPAPASPRCVLFLHGLDVCATPAMASAAISLADTPPPSLTATELPVTFAPAPQPVPRTSRRSRGPSLTAAEGGMT